MDDDEEPVEAVDDVDAAFVGCLADDSAGLAPPVSEDVDGEAADFSPEDPDEDPDDEPEPRESVR